MNVNNVSCDMYSEIKAQLNISRRVKPDTTEKMRTNIIRQRKNKMFFLLIWKKPGELVIMCSLSALCTDVSYDTLKYTKGGRNNTVFFLYTLMNEAGTRLVITIKAVTHHGVVITCVVFHV